MDGRSGNNKKNTWRRGGIYDDEDNDDDDDYMDDDDDDDDSEEERTPIHPRYREQNELRRKRFYKGRYRYFLFGLAFLQTLCCSGIVLGWAALAALLYQRDVYRAYCPHTPDASGTDPSESTTERDADSGVPPLSPSWCREQQARLSLVYVLGLMGMYASRAAFGWFMDTFGAKRTTVVGSIVMGLGSFLLIIALDQEVDLYPYAFGLIGVGSGAIHLACLQFANLFPGAERTAGAILVGAFQASSGVFFALKFLEEWISLDLRVSLVGLMGVAFFCFITAILFWPNRPFVRLPGLQQDSNVMISEDDEDDIFNDDDATDDAYLSRLSFLPAVVTPEYLFIVVFFGFHLLRLDFLTGTLLPQLIATKASTSSDFVSLRIDAWSVALTCGSLAFLGAHYCVEKRGFNLTFTLTNVFSIVYGILALFPAQWATFSPLLIFYAVCRQFVYISVVDYLESVFGLRYHEALQRLLALVMTGVAAAQFPLAGVGLGLLDGNFQHIEILLLLSVVLCFAYLLLLFRKPVEADEDVRACTSTWWILKFWYP